jgi:peptidoglycan hydrolase-like protein with peptidoglycan-binding domain
MKKTFKFIVGAALVVLFSAATASAAYMHSTTLKMGMTNANVMELQKTLNANGFVVSTMGAGSPGMESMYFGAKTKAAVMSFQMAKGLGADGVVGPMTGAALSALTGSTGGSNLPAGCTSTSGYSPVTGQMCSGGSTGGNTGSTGGALTGGAGSVDEYKLLASPSNNQDVGEDQDNVKVLGFSVEADDSSDLNIKSVRLVLGSVPSSPASDNFEDYADSVSVWYGSTKVAEVDADEFNDDNDYTKTISFSSDAIVRKGAVGNFYVAVSGASNLDSDDIGEDWTVDVTNVRWVDAQGATISEEPSAITARTFSFESFASANDVELRLTEATDNPDAQVVMADDNGSTDGVTLLKGKLKAVGSDINIKGMIVTVAATGTGDIEEIASQFIVKIDGDEVDSVDAADCVTTACTASESYDFDDIDVTINEGDTVDFEVLADINEVDGTTVAEGDALTASITMNATNVDAEDQSGEDLTNSELTGAISGDAQSFITQGISVTPGSMNAVAEAVDGAADYSSYTMKVSVTAIDGDVYLDKSFANSSSSSTTASGSNRAAVFNAAGTQLTSGYSASISSTDNDAQELTNTYKISDGATADFTITVNATGTSAQQRAVLYALEWGTSDAATLANVYTSNMGLNGDYKTNLIFVSGS